MSAYEAPGHPKRCANSIARAVIQYGGCADLAGSSGGYYLLSLSLSVYGGKHGGGIREIPGRLQSLAFYVP